MISTHVLDTERGEPACGVRVELHRGNDLVGSAVTDDDGRIRDLSAGQALGPGPYTLVFSGPPSRFFTRVELEIQIEEAERDYHVPLLISSYSCASYRGS